MYPNTTETLCMSRRKSRSKKEPHSLACIDKAKTLLGYAPEFSMRDGLKAAVKWYWENL